MPRHPRLFIPGAIYHVYCRVARGEFVFDDDREAIEFVETLRSGATHRINALLHCIPHRHSTLPLQNLTFSQCVFAKCGTDPRRPPRRCHQRLRPA